MTRRIDHRKQSAADKSRRQGTQDVADLGEIIPLTKSRPKPRPSKSLLREQAAAAVAKVTRIVRCAGCGHSASIALPPSRLGARLRCSKCEEVAT
ncbi:hypothetical protein [Rhizobium leguminosarum]|uniref:hypothetical protein n=1 Tax=Rhizobium leguminosarum TaxID=384 RepID=UPI0010326E79|nr:hypothetical protein [Rhizobium leguminosarum]TBG03778.1 hypothetical protein ELG82_09605 [Rhizobium leguminosarum]